MTSEEAVEWAKEYADSIDGDIISDVEGRIDEIAQVKHALVQELQARGW